MVFEKQVRKNYVFQNLHTKFLKEFFKMLGGGMGGDPLFFK